MPTSEERTVFPRLRALERDFREAVDATGLASSCWRALERVFGDALEFAEFFYAPASPAPFFRSLVARGEHDVAESEALPVGRRVTPVFLEDFATRFLKPEEIERLDLVEDRAMRFSRCAVLVAPLARSGDALGALVVGFSPEAMESAEARRKALACARRLKVIVLRRLSPCLAVTAQAEARANVLTLLRLLKSFGSHRKTPKIAAMALDFFVSEMGFRRALLARVDEDGQNVYGLDSRGFEDVARLVRFPIATGADCFATAARENVAIAREISEDDETLPVFLRGRGIEQIVALPMRVEDQCVGVIFADNDPSRHPLPLDVVEQLQWAADLLGQSIYVSSIYESLRRTAETDPLTGVFNRFALTQILEEEIPNAKRFGQALSLLMIDLCDFKKFNDVYGHVVGDRVLKTVANLLMRCTRKTDKVARFGGDEFLVLMPNTSEDKAEAVKSRIEQAVRDQNEAAQHESEVFMLSIGLKSAEADAVDNILEEADEEMFKKKAAQSRQKLYNALTSNNLDEMKKSDNFVAVLIKNLTEREPHFLEHARHVMVWSQAICQMIGADDETIERVSLAALLHDIGKIALPSGLLTKTGPLTKEDHKHIRQHPTAGSDFLSGHKFLGDLRIIIHHHHERWDGRTDGPHAGYPSGYAGELIPLGSRIIRVAETFDDLVSPRPYRPRPCTTAKALEILRSEAGHALDPRLVQVFADYVEMINSPLAAM